VAVLSSSVSPAERNKVAALKANFIEKARNLDESVRIGKIIKHLALERNERLARAAP